MYQFDYIENIGEFFIFLKVLNRWRARSKLLYRVSVFGFPWPINHIYFSLCSAVEWAITFPIACPVFCFIVCDRCLFWRVRGRSHPVLLAERALRKEYSHFYSYYFVTIIGFRFGIRLRFLADRGATNCAPSLAGSGHFARLWVGLHHLYFPLDFWLRHYDWSPGGY